MQMTNNNNSNIVAYVECPPYPLSQLSKDEEFTIGRGVYNRLVLSLDNVSRYHAVIKWSNNGFVIEDLGSSNGTFVNDETIQAQHRLQSGDKILIGNQLITYRESQKNRAFQNNKTLRTEGQNLFRVPSVEEIKNLRSSLQGSIETIPLFSILQMLSGDKQTGCLTIKKLDGKVGDIYFREGNVVHTEISGHTGEEVFFEIMKWEKGEFQFHKGKHPVRETMHENLQRLLLEGLRILDEG